MKKIHLCVLSVLFILISACQKDCFLESADYLFGRCSNQSSDSERVKPIISSITNCAANNTGPAYFVSGCFTNIDCSDSVNYSFDHLGFVYAKDNPFPTFDDDFVGVSITDLSGDLGSKQCTDLLTSLSNLNKIASPYFGLDIDGNLKEISINQAPLPSLIEGQYFIVPYVNVIVDHQCEFKDDGLGEFNITTVPKFYYNNRDTFTVSRLNTLGDYLSLSGVGYAEIAEPPAFLQQDAKNFTISFWMRTTNDLGFFFEHDDFEVFVSDNHVGVKVNEDVFFSSNSGGGELVFADNKWHQFVIGKSVTEDGLAASIKVLMDGKFIVNQTGIGFNSLNNSPISIGASLEENEEGVVVGLAPRIDIDEIAIWNKDISAQFFNSINGSFCPIENNPIFSDGLIAYWPLNGNGAPKIGEDNLLFDFAEQYSFKPH